MPEHEHFTNKIVKTFLDSNLSLILIVLATILGFAALWLTPREEDPQIVVPLADIRLPYRWAARLVSGRVDGRHEHGPGRQHRHGGLGLE